MVIREEGEVDEEEVVGELSWCAFDISYGISCRTASSPRIVAISRYRELLLLLFLLFMWMMMMRITRGGWSVGRKGFGTHIVVLRQQQQQQEGE